MAEHILFLTGKLAARSLARILDSLEAPGFTWDIHNIGVSVAALMTSGMIQRRLKDLKGADRVIVPGLCRGDLEEAGAHFGVPFERGPVDLKDMPQFFGQGGRRPDLSRYEALIFAEIVDAPEIGIEAILARAARYRRDGADVIDVGCLPDGDFPQLEEAVAALKAAGYRVSVDSMNDEDLLRGGRAGADYLLSLKESSLWIATEVESTPVLIPERSGDMDSLYRAIDSLLEQGRDFLADSILDPIHFGFTDSVCRYRQLRADYPDIRIMIGNGNVTELTEADTSGMNAILMGIVSELSLDALLTTEVSPHACSVVRETDRARRIMYAAKRDDSLPKGYDSGLTTTHLRKPYAYTSEEIAELAAQVRDPSYRIQISMDGIHVYNRDGLHSASDPYALFPRLERLQEDAPHAFYMGVELARAEIARELGRRYVQDEPLDWGCAVYREPDPGRQLDTHRFKEAGSTLKASRDKNRKK